jgi:hypothetical protein
MQNISIKFLIYALLAVFLTSSLLSCAHTQNITGKWQEAGKKSTLEFHKNGTFNAVDDMGMAVSGKYTLQENGDIRFEITHEGSAPEIIDGKLNVQEDALTLSFSDNKEIIKYKRVK